MLPSFVLGLACACTAAPRDLDREAEGLVADELLTVLAAGELDLPPQSAESAFATSQRAWERVRARAGFAALPPHPCDFEHTAVLLVVASAADASTSLQHRIGTEEGVDVVTVVGTGDEKARSGSSLSRALWLIVPARPRQLAVVLQEPGASGALVERTLAVHAPRE